MTIELRDNDLNINDDEQVPTARAVRMVVGFSNASSSSSLQKDLHADVVETSDSTTSMRATVFSGPKRQGSDGTAATERTSSTSFAEAEEISEHELSESLAALPSPPDVTELVTDAASVAVEDYDDESSTTSSDGSGVFSMHKIYGREREEEMLYQTYNHIMNQSSKDPTRRKELNYVLISGGVGSGKSTVADLLRRKVTAEGGFFCTGTFDQMNQRGPVQPMVDAFAEYVRHVFETGQEEITIARRRIRSFVDPKDLPCLMSILPSLRDLLGDEQGQGYKTCLSTTSTPSGGKEDERIGECKTNGAEKMGHSHFAMMKLMRAISRSERPVVMMLDDIHYAVGCAFEYLKSFVLDDLNDSFMFLGVTRNDVSPQSHISQFLREIEDQSVRITNIELTNLQLKHVQEMISDSFLMPDEQMASLADFLHEASSGNPFFLTTAIRTLQNNSHFLDYDKEKNVWSLNSNTVDNFMCHCPVELVRRKLDTYPRDQKKVLMVVACLGSHSTQKMIEAALQEDATEPLKKLVKKCKLKYDEKDETYTIGHNAIKDAAYNLIGEELQPAFHLEVGLRLMKNLDSQELEDRLFCVFMQLQKGLSLLQDQATRYDVAALFVRVAEKAATTFSFNLSLFALKNAYDLLGPNHWEEAYELTLAIYNYLAEIQFSLNDNDFVDQLLNEIYEHGRNCADRRQAYVTKVHVLGVRGQADAAIDKGICILRRLGVHLPANARKLNLVWSMAKVARNVKGKSNESLRRLPEMTDPKLLTAMQVLNLLFFDTFLHRRALFPFVVLKMMKLSLQNGLSAMSSVAFAGYGSLLCFMGKAEEGQRFGKLGLDLVDRFNASSFRPRCIALVYGCIQPAMQPWKNSIYQLIEGHRLGLMTGDVESAIFNANLALAFMLDDGSFKYRDLVGHLDDIIELTKAHGQSRHLNMIISVLEALRVFNDPDGDLINGTAAIESSMKVAVESGNVLSICMLYCTRICCLYSAGDYQKALKVLDERDTALTERSESIFDSFAIFMDGLTSFSCARNTSKGSARTSLVQRGKKAMKLLQKLSLQNPDSCAGKALILEAEYAAVCKKKSLANQKFSQAVALSVGHKNYFETFVSKQLVGVHYCVDLDDGNIGINFLEESIVDCEEWGGHAAAAIWRKKVTEIKQTRGFSILGQKY